MKQQIVKKLIRFLYDHPNEPLRRIELFVLMKITASAAGIKGRHILFIRDPLAVYARFTKEAAALPGTGPEKFFAAMKRLGRDLRIVTGLSEEKDLDELLFLLYRNIGIELSGNTEEGFHFTKCYFSRFYSPHECKVISALDAGIAAGLLGNGKLVFTQRITEGCAVCEACFRKESE